MSADINNTRNESKEEVENELQEKKKQEKNIYKEYLNGNLQKKGL